MSNDLCDACYAVTLAGKPTSCPDCPKNRNDLRCQRRFEQERTTYTFRNADDQYVDSFTFRHVIALVAADQGRVRCRLKRSYSPWYCDSHLRPECDDHGIGYGTLTELQSRWNRPPLIEPCDQEGPLGLTSYGRRILDEIQALQGAEVRAA